MVQRLNSAIFGLFSVAPSKRLNSAIFGIFYYFLVFFSLNPPGKFSADTFGKERKEILITFVPTNLICQAVSQYNIKFLIQ